MSSVQLLLQLLLQPRLYNLLLHSQKRQTTVANTSRDGVVRKIPVFFVRCNQFEPLFNNYNTTGKIILYLVKNLDSVVVHVRHSYSSITKNCGRPWTVKLSYLTTFTPKLCNKRFIKFKNLNSVIIFITDH